MGSRAAGLQAFVLANEFKKEPIINGVQHFYRSTKPTVRVNNSALVEGDIWYKPTNNGITGTRGWWHWNGTYWTSDLFTIESYNLAAYSASSGMTVEMAAPRLDIPLLLTRWGITFIPSGTVNNSTDYWTFALSGRNGSTIYTLSPTTLSTQGNAWTTNRNYVLQDSTSVVLNAPTNDTASTSDTPRTFGLAVTKVAAPSNFSQLSLSAALRWIHP